MAIVGRSTYPAGSALTEVSGGGDTAQAYLQAMLAREATQMNENQRQSEIQRRRQRAAAQPQKATKGGTSSHDIADQQEGFLRQAQIAKEMARLRAGPAQDPNKAIREQAEAMALRTEIIKNQKMTQPGGGPKRMTTFGAGNNFYTPDVGSYDAIDKQLYLPQGSSRVGTAAEAAAAESDVTSEAAWQAMMARQRAGTQTTNLPPRNTLTPEQAAAQQRTNQMYGR